MSEVALFGGAFNPPHLAHIFTMTYLLGRSDVDEVWLIPTASHVFGKTLAPLDVRISMLKTVIEEYGWENRVKVLDVEGRREGPSRTFDTLTELSEQHRNHRFRWVIGADNLTERHRWYRFDDLVSRWNLIVLGRPGHEASLAACRGLPWCDAGPTMPSISSTQIRDALMYGHDVDSLHWLPSTLLEQAKTLYQRTEHEGVQVTIFGYGRAGRSLSAALKRRGVSVLTWNRSAVVGADFCGEFPEKVRPGIWLLTVSDEAIPNLASQLAKQYARLSEVTVFHCAGRHDADLMEPLKQIGAAVGVFHPIQALLGQPDDVKDAWCVVSGATAVHPLAEQLAEWIGGRYVRRTGADASGYHAAAVLTANFVSTLLHTGVELMESAGIDRTSATAMLHSLLSGTVTNLSSKPPVEALTGPFARKDFDAIYGHVERIQTQAPSALPTYRSLAYLTARMMSWTDLDMDRLDGAFDGISERG